MFFSIMLSTRVSETKLIITSVRRVIAWCLIFRLYLLLIISHARFNIIIIIKKKRIQLTICYLTTFISIRNGSGCDFIEIIRFRLGCKIQSYQTVLQIQIPIVINFVRCKHSATLTRPSKSSKYSFDLLM